MSAKIPKALFYILSFTWGLPMTLIGCIISLGLIIVGYKPKRWNYCWYFEVGERWGGFELGTCFIKDKTYSVHIMNHEHGHGIQNCYLGVLMPFVVSIPSAIRYWYRELKYERKGLRPKTDYDDIWFEGSATKLGTELNTWLKEKEATK